MEVGLFLFKALSNLSLANMFFNFLFGIAGKVPAWHPLLFLGANLLSLLVFYLRKRGLKKSQFLLGGIVVPVSALVWFAFVSPSSKDLIFANRAYVGVQYISALYVGWSGIRPKQDYGFAAEVFTKGLALALFLAVVLLLQGKTQWLGRNFAVYMLVFLVSSIYLLRTLRYLRYNDDEGQLRSINLGYAVSTLTAAFVLGSAAVREFLAYLLGQAYDGLVWLISHLFSWLALPFLYFLNFVRYGWKKAEWKKIQSMNKAPDQAHAFQGPHGVQPVLSAEWRGRIQALGEILIVCLVLYGLFRLLRRFHYVGRESEGYRESRESLRPLRERKSRFPRKFGLFAGRNGVETIRHDYERFLRLSLKRNISLLHSDTTSEIEQKGGEHFEKEVLKDMRGIYIRVRYGEETCGEDRVREFAGLFKRLVQGPRAK